MDNMSDKLNDVYYEQLLDSVREYISNLGLEARDCNRCENIVEHYEMCNTAKSIIAKKMIEEIKNYSK